MNGGKNGDQKPKLDSGEVMFDHKKINILCFSLTTIGRNPCVAAYL